MTLTAQDVPVSVVAFIGGGNMARSLIGGLLARGQPPAAIHVADPSEQARNALHDDFGVRVFADAADAVAGADAWVLAVKPQVMREVCRTLAPLAAQQRPLAVSIAAGITSGQLQRWLGDGAAVVRTMPNTPSLLGAGVTGLYAGDDVDADGRALAQRLLESAGTTVWIEDEALMDAVTAVSGSGPAYVFLLAEAMQDAGRAEGLDAAAARELTLQTLLGAARMLVESDVDAAELRRRVTSPGGTTQAAIEHFEHGGLRTLVAGAIHAARKRGAELSAAQD
ncbi:MAG: pyrroline-5-carboxylate reductase [Pseudoxanthomonas suwonensis]|nr:pyrroline-5-carboxylate reductase [Pseudoxanthomonas suwonensis]